MPDRARIYDLLTYIRCLSEPVEGVPETVDRLTEINKATKELAHEIGKLR